MKKGEKIIIYPFLYVGDNLFENSSKEDMNKLNEIFNGEFKIQNLSEVKMILWMNIMRNRERNELLFLS